MALRSSNSWPLPWNFNFGKSLTTSDVDLSQDKTDRIRQLWKQSIASVCFSGLLEAVVLEEDLMPFTKKLWITLLREDFGQDCKLRWFQELPSISQTSLPNIWRFRGIWVRGVSCGFLAREMTTACVKLTRLMRCFDKSNICFLIFLFLSWSTSASFFVCRNFESLFCILGHAWPCYAQPVLSNLTGLLHLPVQSHHHWPCCRRLQV